MDDIYKTIQTPAEAAIREQNSKFLAFAYPLRAVEQVKDIMDGLRKKYYDATHHCFAYRIGANGAIFKVNDDGEPSGTAGRPILGQLMSAGITDCLIVVVRYFGGTKLGVPGLISAYKKAALMVIDAAKVIEKTDDAILHVEFPYVILNDVMKIIKEERPQVISQHIDNVSTMTLSIRKSKFDALCEKLKKCGIKIEHEQQ